MLFPRQPHRRHSFFRPQIDLLENRVLMTIFTVTNTDDSGPGSLRQAILDANDNPGLDTIAFNIKNGGLQIIHPTSPLPDITDPVIIDGTTQPGFKDAPLIVLDGSTAGPSAAGLTVTAGNSTVQGLVIDAFGGSGIDLGSDGDLVAGNWIGTDATGTQAFGNGEGVLVRGNFNRIGGTTAGMRNVISGNRNGGIHFAGHFKPPDASDNLVQGNFIGTDFTGTKTVGNGTGIAISGGALDNTIGGTSPAARNIISGNQGSGIGIGNGEDNLIQGNFIGTDVTGTIALANSFGIAWAGYPNTVGGTTPGAGNLISGNTLAGISLASASGPVQGNFIGTDVTGTQALGNGTGISITDVLPGQVIGGTAAGAGNLISGNRSDGLDITDCSGVLVLGNRIGTDVNGIQAVSNQIGVVFSGGSGNTVGGTIPSARNIISGNTLDGIDFLSSSDNQVIGNFIGTDASGTHALGNGLGVYIFGGSRNTVGGTMSGASNLISGNRGPGIDLVASNNQVQGNFIGTDTQGQVAIANRDGIFIAGSGNTIGAIGVAMNLISGNLFNGILISGSQNQVWNNLIGTDITGTAALGNRTGVAISGGSQNTVGSTLGGSGNLISGNREDGVAVVNGTANVVLGNTIGTDRTGMIALGNRAGINVAVGVTGTTIGGIVRGAGNLVAGNRADGITIAGNQNEVLGNHIGTLATGNGALANTGNGISITGGSNNTIGGADARTRNLISANGRYGILIMGGSNQVLGNYIGTDETGTASLGNVQSGVFIVSGSANVVGGTAAGAGNLIAGNNQYGVLISDSVNRVEGNTIGTDFSGTAPLGNSVGVYISRGSANVVGGTEPGAGNLISGNSTGIIILANGNLVQGNRIGTDRTGTMAIGNNYGVSISSATTDTTLGGTTPAARNIISGNHNEGVAIITSSRNLVLGNFIGTDITGTRPLGNGTGVFLDGGSGNRIGGPAVGNLIAGNAGAGILIMTTFSSANFVQGNFIGTDVTGTADLGNGLNGVEISASSNNLIGGTEAGDANTIAHSGNNGVLIDRGTGNGVQQNSIFASGNLGIALINNGNNNQAFPVLTSAVSDGSTTMVAGTLASAPNTIFTFEFFQNAVCNPSGFGEGESFLGSNTVMTDPAGNAEFTAEFGTPVDLDRFITATATDPSNNTSQFSACIPVTPPGHPGLHGMPTPSADFGLRRFHAAFFSGQPDITHAPWAVSNPTFLPAINPSHERGLVIDSRTIDALFVLENPSGSSSHQRDLPWPWTNDQGPIANDQ